MEAVEWDAAEEIDEEAGMLSTAEGQFCLGVSTADELLVVSFSSSGTSGLEVASI